MCTATSWGSSGRRFKSCQPDAGKRVFLKFTETLTVRVIPRFSTQMRLSATRYQQSRDQRYGSGRTENVGAVAAIHTGQGKLTDEIPARRCSVEQCRRSGLGDCRDSRGYALPLTSIFRLQARLEGCTGQSKWTTFRSYGLASDRSTTACG
jgi:hypothetical protein